MNRQSESESRMDRLVQAALSFHVHYPDLQLFAVLSAAKMAEVGISPPIYTDESVFPGNLTSIQTDFMCDVSSPAWKLGTWDTFLDEVHKFAQCLPDTGTYLKAEGLCPISHKHDVAADLQVQLEGLGSNISAFSCQTVMGWPDVCVEWDRIDPPALLVGLVELDILPPLSPDRIQEELLSSPACAFWPVLNRMREFMASGPIRFGFVTTRKWFWFCYGDRSMLALSPAVEVEKITLACFWYLMALSEVKEEMVSQTESASWWTVGRVPDFRSLKESMQAMVKELAEEISGKKRKIHRKLQFWSREELNLGARICKHRCDVMFATKPSGEQVVVKIRDLGHHYFTVKQQLRRFVNEIVAYRKLKSIQNNVIPKLHGYGLMCGGMFAVLVLSFVGENKDFISLDRALARPYGEAAVRGLKKIHERGLVHGEIAANCVMVRDRRLSFVGFSEARPPRKPRDLSREVTLVETMFGMWDDDEDDDQEDRS